MACLLYRYIFEAKENKQHDAKEKNEDTGEKKTLKGKVIARLQVFFFFEIHKIYQITDNKHTQ